MLKLLNKKFLYLAALAIALIFSFWAGRNSADPEIKIETQVVEKIVEKVIEVEVNKESEKVNKNTKIIEKPDGTKITEITEISEKETKSANKKKSDSERDSSSQKTASKKPNVLANYRLGAQAGINIKNLKIKPDLIYGANAGIRAYGPFWIDASYNTSGSAMVGISVEF